MRLLPFDLNGIFFLGKQIKTLRRKLKERQIAEKVKLKARERDLKGERWRDESKRERESTKRKIIFMRKTKIKENTEERESA